METFTIHSHILTPALTDEKFSLGRFNVPAWASKLAFAIYKELGDKSIGFIDELIDKITGEDIDLKPFVHAFFCTPEQAQRRLLAAMDEADIDYAVVLDVMDSDYEIISDRLIRFVSEEYMKRLMKENDGDWGVVPDFGIKFYPKISEPDEEILDIAYDFDLPCVAHCSKGGIHGDQSESAANKAASPDAWAVRLTNRQNMRICLAHAGGCTDFVNFWLDGTPGWMQKIFNLMLVHPNMYIDISFHDMAMTNPARYFAALKAAIHSVIGTRILLGDDYPLILTEYSLADFIKQIRKHLTLGEYELIASKNSKAFLKR